MPNRTPGAWLRRLCRGVFASPRPTEELRLREARHRMKNDLNVIAALIDRVRETVSSSALDAVLAQVQSIATLYDLLAAGGEATTDLSVYIAAVVSIHDERLRVKGSLVRIQRNLSPLSVPVKIASTVGIVANELLVNADKYAFGSEGGVIRIGLRRGGRTGILTVSDDGGKTGSGSSSSSGLGLDLVRGILSDIGGSLTINRSGGWTCVAEFPADG